MRKKLKKLLNNNLAIFGLILCVILTLACIFAPLLTKYGANTVEVNEILLAPSKEHIMGTDQLGRDVFARLLYGGRISIAVGVISDTITGDIALGNICLNIILKLDIPIALET